MSDEWTSPGDTPVRPSVQDDGFPSLALAAGLVAALLGGVIWAAIGIYGNLEVGWVAWGIGLLVGGAMAMTTPVRSRQLAVAAAALALVGLLAGKAMTFAGSTGVIAEEMLADDEYMRGVTAWRMYGAAELDPALQAAVADTEARGDTLSDADWAEMLTAAETRLAALSDDEREAIAREVAGTMIRQMGLVAGVRAQLSGFDLLWLLLALATAFRMLEAPKPEPVVEIPVEGEEEEQRV